MTTEEQDYEQSYSDYVAQMAYELKPYSVMCDLCGCERRATEKQLKADGWFLANGMEVCGRHN